MTEPSFEPADREEVLAREVDFSTYNLPKLSNVERNRTYERIVAAERRIASPDLTVNGYNEGSARVDNELLALEGLSSVVITAEHATTYHSLVRAKPNERRQRTRADYGTAGLAWVGCEDTSSSLVVPVGRQIGDVDTDEIHPLKRAVTPLVANPHNFAHLSLQGMNIGRVATISDERSFNVLIGIGDRATPETKIFAERATEIARKYDLRIGVNQKIVRFQPHSNEPRYNPDKTVAAVRYDARGCYRMREFAKQLCQELGKPLVAAEISLSGSLRLLPPESPNYPGEESQRTGTYLGYLFLRECIEIINEM